MARTRGKSPAQEARGEMLRQIREEAKATQEAWAEKLNDVAIKLRLPTRYKHYTISRVEGGTVTFEDAVIWLSLAPSRTMDLHWLIFEPYKQLGKEIKRTRTQKATG